MTVGGARPGAGRPKGVPNKKTQERIEAIEAEGITPLEYMLNVLRDENQDNAARMDAAKSAAPYVHPRLANVDANVQGQLVLGKLIFPGLNADG